MRQQRGDEPHGEEEGKMTDVTSSKYFHRNVEIFIDIYLSIGDMFSEIEVLHQTTTDNTQETSEV